MHFEIEYDEKISMHICMFTCKVIAQASEEKICWDHDLELWKVYVHAAPEKGKANKAVCALLANKLKISSSSISFFQGLTTPRKVLKIISSKYTTESEMRAVLLNQGKEKR